METETYTQVMHSVKKILNIDLTHYKDEQMKRRLDSWLTRVNSPGWQEYFQLIAHNTDEQSRFRNYLTINVTEFFRDPDRWAALRTQVLPRLAQEAAARGRTAPLKIWSAGCSIGIEAYTLSILLDETLRSQPYTILASDLDRGALLKAKSRGPYRADEVRNLTPEQKDRYIETIQGQFYAREALMKPIRFMEQDLNADRFDTGFDLIICRNVIIYFTNDAKGMLYRKFHAALRPGGVLFLGGTEIIPSPKEIGFRNWITSFYVKE